MSQTGVRLLNINLSLRLEQQWTYCIITEDSTLES